LVERLETQAHPNRLRKILTPDGLKNEIYDLLKSLESPVLATFSGNNARGRRWFIEYIERESNKNFPVTVINTDDYLINEESTQHETTSKKTNFDRPRKVDIYKLTNDVQSLKAGVSIKSPVCNKKASGSYPGDQTIEAKDLIIVAGRVANHPDLRELSDLSVTFATWLEERCRLGRKSLQCANETAKDIKERIEKPTEPSYKDVSKWNSSTEYYCLVD